MNKIFDAQQKSLNMRLYVIMSYCAQTQPHTLRGIEPPLSKQRGVEFTTIELYLPSDGKDNNDYNTNELLHSFLDVLMEHNFLCNQNKTQQE